MESVKITISYKERNKTLEIERSIIEREGISADDISDLLKYILV